MAGSPRLVDLIVSASKRNPAVQTRTYECAGPSADGRIKIRDVGTNTVLGLARNNTTSTAFKSGDPIKVVIGEDGEMCVIGPAPGRRTSTRRFAV